MQTSRLPGGNFVFSSVREPTIATTKASNVTTKASSVTTKAPSVTIKASSIFTTEAAASISAKTGTETIVRFVISAVMPLNRSRIIRLELLKEVWHLLLRLQKDLDKVSADVIVTVVVEGSGLTLVTDTSSATNAMNVLGNAGMLR